MSDRGPRKIDGWSAFLGWLLVGGLASFAFLGAASIGLLAVPFVVILVVMMGRARPPSHSLLGLLAGAGVMLMFIGVLNLGQTPCDETGTLVDGEIVFGYVEGGSEENGAETSCGGWPPAPWLVIGGVAFAAGAGMFAVAERRARDTEMSENQP